MEDATKHTHMQLHTSQIWKKKPSMLDVSSSWNSEYNIYSLILVFLSKNSSELTSIISSPVLFYVHLMNHLIIYNLIMLKSTPLDFTHNLRTVQSIYIDIYMRCTREER